MDETEIWVHGFNASLLLPLVIWEKKIKVVLKDFPCDRCKYMRAVFQQLMTLQTSVWFKCVIDRSKALCKAIYYIPAAHQMHSGKLLIHLINDPFHVMTLNQYFSLFINIVPAFQPSHLLSRIALLQVRAANFGAFNLRLYSARYCVLVAFCSCDSVSVSCHLQCKDFFF